MFSIHLVIGQGFDKAILLDEEQQTAVELIPSAGALLHGFTIRKNGQAINIIDSYAHCNDLSENIEINYKNVKLSPYPGRIHKGKYHFEGTAYTLTRPMMVGSSIHGLLYNAPFTIVGSKADEESAILSLRHEYQGDDAGYPFAYHCTVDYELSGNNTLTITTTIRNTGTGNMPLGDGWHPYFTFGKKIDALELQIASANAIDTEDMIPNGKLLPYDQFQTKQLIGETELDHCFLLSDTGTQPCCTLADNSSGLSIEIYPAKNYPYLVVFTPPHRNSIAIENQSMAPDAFNNGMGLTVLKAGEEQLFEVKYRVAGL
jgi:aldose 1-epimerase